MTLGRNSIIAKIMVPNAIQFEGEVIVQCDKLHRICDMEPRINDIFNQFKGRQLDSINVYEELEEELNDYFVKL
jgi:hypothetical protein